MKTRCVGLCGSDHHYWKHGSIAHFVVKDPLILGHETCADVIEVGEGVEHLQVGDRVAVEPTVPCRICNFCKTGSYNLCPNVKWYQFFHLNCFKFFSFVVSNDCPLVCSHGTPPVHGTLRKYFKYDADFCFK